MKKILLLLMGLIPLLGLIQAQPVLLLQESFEGDQTNFDANFFTSGDATDFFNAVNSSSLPSGWSGGFTSFNGSYYVAGEDIACVTNAFGSVESGYIVFKTLNVTGYSSIQVKVLFAAVTSSEFENWITTSNEVNIDGFIVQYAFDDNIATTGDANVRTGTYSDIVRFRGNNPSGGSALYEDLNLDDFGEGTQLTKSFQEFTYEFNTSGATSLSIRIIAASQTANEELAFDNVRIYGIAPTNSAPTDIALSTSSVNENVAGNTTVGTLSTTDADAGDTHTYSLVAGTGDTDNGAFNISGSDLRITNSPNYETKNSYSVRVQTSDGTATYSEAFTITINDVAEPPTVTTQAVGSILATTATGNGNITVLGEPTPTQYGVVWSESANPTVDLLTKTTQGVPGETGAFTSSITGLSPNTTYHVRAYATNTAATAYGDDVTFTTLTNGTFTSTVSNDWATAGNWAGGSIPTSGTDVTIPAGKTAEIAPGTSANCNNITIDPAGSLTIKSDATNAGSLIVAGTATGNVTYQSYLAETGKWHVVTAPVAGQNVWGFATLAGNSIAEKTGKRAVTEYIEATNTWDTNYPTADTEGSFAAGSGYSVLRSDVGVVSYTGAINTSDVSKPITRSLYGWNALGNPYTSAINATETAHATNNLITANTDNLDQVFAALYVWDAASGQYVTINNTGTGTLVQNYIQAGQGFFVRAKNNSGLSFSITEAMQTHQPATPLKSGENTWPTIVLSAKSDNKQSSTMVTFNSQMTNGLDVTYDAGMFKADKNFALYSKLVDDNGNDFAIQALPEKFEGLIVPLGIDAPAGTEISFSAGTFNLPGEATVYIEDRASNRFTKLDATEAVYTVTITDQTKGAGNFYLHTSAATTGIEDQKNGIQVYTRDRAIFVSGNLDAKDVVAVYGIDGKLHYKNTAGQNGLLRIDAAGLPAGIYLVSISQEAGRVTNKIILGE